MLWGIANCSSNKCFSGMMSDINSLMLNLVSLILYISESDTHSSYSEECISTPLPMTSSDSQPLDIRFVMMHDIQFIVLGRF